MAQITRVVPTDLQELCERFEAWRRTRSGKLPIPEPLWAAAAQLARSHGVCQTAQVLRLQDNELTVHDIHEDSIAITATSSRVAFDDLVRLYFCHAPLLGRDIVALYVT
jgi:hypothetical protein